MNAGHPIVGLFRARGRTLPRRSFHTDVVPTAQLWWCNRAITTEAAWFGLVTAACGIVRCPNPHIPRVSLKWRFFFLWYQVKHAVRRKGTQTQPVIFFCSSIHSFPLPRTGLKCFRVSRRLPCCDFVYFMRKWFCSPLASF